MAASKEQFLISSILRNGDLAKALKAGVTASMFYSYKDEFDWILDYYQKRSRTPTKAVFRTKFSVDQFNIKEVDDTEFLSEEVKQEHKSKSTYNAIQTILDHLDEHDPDMALNFMSRAATKISSELGLINDGDIFRDHDDIMNEYLARRERYETLGTSGIPTGFNTFDSRTGGFAAGEFHVFAARPGATKSWSLQKFASYAALKGYTVQFNALEQPRANVMARILSLISPSVGDDLYTSRSLIRGHGYDAIRFQKFMNSLKTNVKGKLHVADGTKGKVTTSMVAGQIERNKPDIVFIDHITLMGRPTKDFAGVAEVADELTQLSNQFAIPIVSAAQLNRTGTNDGAGVEAIAEADKIGQNASGVVFLKQLSPHVTEYVNRKSRNDEGGFSWHAEFKPDQGIFQEVTQAQAKEIMLEDHEAARG